MPKGLFQSTHKQVIDTILRVEDCFAAVYGYVELRTSRPKQAYWNGGGAWKDTSASIGLQARNSFAEQLGIEVGGPDARFQIDITAIFDELYPFLEKLIPSNVSLKRVDEILKTF